jgi:hypothetical protein
LLALLLALGCSSYDSQLIGPEQPSLADAAAPVRAHSKRKATTHADAGTLAGRDAGMSDASDLRDARVDSAFADAAQPDAAQPDAASDASSPADAGCDALDARTDCCPDDPAKTAPGQCGCGHPDTDSDADGTADCVDGCPNDVNKTAPGTCGCGRADSDQGTVVSCSGLLAALVHRYGFDGSGTAITDARGTAHGVLENTQLTGTGQLDLSGGTSNQYVDLPNGLISSLTDATFEVWLSWSGQANWERIFDFGDNSNATEGNQGTGKTYLFLTPRTSGTGGAMRVAYSVNGNTAETSVDAPSALSTTGMHQVVVVVDDSNNKLLLYLDGAAAGSKTLTGSLSAIHDINNWLGRSQYSSDAEFGGSLYEFRIYNAALSAGQVAFSFGDGPDPAYLSP